ncbi:guanine nucleotide exchange factor for Rab-3A-like [Photinus pyralis]|nr:guanine nucleotide exchange factor for Rab-3A-like [Photinus pyralis]XP_031340521.1 guanine nucleotide exchange factor for Rab-3A-like [Photinus pyralis]
MKTDQSIIMDSDGSVSIGKGLLMTPKTVGYQYVVSKHKRAGSTGTTGDESYTTDEEDNVDDEPDCSIKEHVTSKLFDNHEHDFAYSDIATIADKVEHLSVMHRNSSDSSVYSDLGLDKTDELHLQYPNLCATNCYKRKDDQVTWTRSAAEVKEQTFAKLQKELQEAHQELKLRDEEVNRLSRIRQDVETELEDLTASLFQEAHHMVQEAKEKQAAAEKALKESQMKVDVLTAEVSALKTLVLTSTPSRPNPHLHPQIDLKGKEELGVALFAKKHRRSPSHYNLKYGRENSPPDSPVRDLSPPVCLGTDIFPKEGLEVDPIVHQEFISWRNNPTLDKTNPFIKRIYTEDINLCLAFDNSKLVTKVAEAVDSGTILIEAVSDKTKAMFPKKCALLEVPRLCFYRMNIGEPDVWYSISQICRNRIISVCDFLNYLKYIERGLVKSSVHEVYWEIIRLRKNMVLARLGLSLNA